MREVGKKSFRCAQFVPLSALAALPIAAFPALLGSIDVRTESDRVILSYRHSQSNWQPQYHEYPVWLEWTRCHYGGQRAWFLCPAAGCGRRVAILYLGEIAACRHCHSLSYDTQREASWSRALRKAQSIRRRLGGSGSLAEHFPDKPKRDALANVLPAVYSGWKRAEPLLAAVATETCRL